MEMVLINTREFMTMLMLKHNPGSSALMKVLLGIERPIFHSIYVYMSYACVGWIFS